MGTAKDEEQPTPAELRKKFGDEADTYAEVRAEAAAAAGSGGASEKWSELASELRGEETTDSESE
jgi:hypothetical protein